MTVSVNFGGKCTLLQAFMSNMLLFFDYLFDLLLVPSSDPREEGRTVP